MKFIWDAIRTFLCLAGGVGIGAGLYAAVYYIGEAVRFSIALLK
jgi:hypothetical protein